ncbi:uncharacterized protein N7479_001172 [Penicillium vulpinum]|uniref:uncharacterized protein n=1 Tax=Penicillium vulpinum TaxID=29845 RepID=UPI00254931CC|nr:uncharacterized protein N7479_001172 [Penicillium vulpinum]KAJ5971254.1 hypothetical protein N7479_001172 [Penicillium vulpinum]
MVTYDVDVNIYGAQSCVHLNLLACTNDAVHMRGSIHATFPTANRVKRSTDAIAPMLKDGKDQVQGSS